MKTKPERKKTTAVEALYKCPRCGRSDETVEEGYIGEAGDGDATDGYPKGTFYVDMQCDDVFDGCGFRWMVFLQPFEWKEDK